MVRRLLDIGIAPGRVVLSEERTCHGELAEETQLILMTLRSSVYIYSFEIFIYHFKWIPLPG